MKFYDIYRKELKESGIIPLDEHFFKKLAEFMKKYYILLEESKDNLEDYKEIYIEFSNAKTSVDKFLKKRLEKLLKNLILEVCDDLKVINKDNLTYEERILYELLSTLFVNYKKYIISKILSGEVPELHSFIEDTKSSLEKKSKPKTKILLFKKDISQILDEHGEEIGPFKERDIAIFSKNFAETLINNDICEELEID